MKCLSVLPMSLLLVLVSDLAAGQSADPYRKFNEYRAAARSGQPYPGAPLKGKLIGFANFAGTIPFCVAVENSIKEQLKLAGLDLGRSWISVDNQGDPEVALKNAQTMLRRKPDLFIEFQLYPEVNAVVASMFGSAGIPVLGIDQPVPGAPYMGVDNYKVARLAGHEMARRIREKWGGWGGVDLVVIERLAEGPLRSRGVVEALVQEFGITRDDPKLVQFECDYLAPEEEGYGMKNVLRAHPSAANLAMYAHNDETMIGMIAAVQNAGRWDPARKIAIATGADEIGRAAIRDGSIDATVAFFPERYGEYIVPAVSAMLTGNPVVPFIAMDNEIITRQNIDRYYPRRK